MQKIRVVTFLSFFISLQLVQLCESFKIVPLILSNQTLTSRNDTHNLNTTTTVGLHKNKNSTLVEIEQVLHNNSSTTGSDDLNDLNSTSITPSPAIQKLAQVLNDTLLSINDMIVNSMRNVSEKGQKDFQNVGDMLRNVQTILTEKGSIVSSQAAEEGLDNLERELRAIQAFLREQKQNLFQNFSNSSFKTSFSTNNSLPAIGAIEESKSRSGNSSNREAKSGPLFVNSLMQISSKVGEGVRSTVEGAENIVTNSISMMQNQIQSIVQGISEFISNAGNTLNRRVSKFNLPPKQPAISPFGGREIAII